MKRTVLGLFVAALLLAGLLFSVATVDRSKALRDVDEAAWIFNGYFFGLYAAGDWKNPDWNAFDMYANHPPVGSFLFGALLASIGEPVTSVEPRRFYFENDLDLVNFRDEFVAGLKERFTQRQLVAGRTMSAVIGWLAAAALMLLAWRLAGPVAGVTSFVLLLLHPAFRSVQMLASVDTFLMLLSILAVLLAFEMGRGWGGGGRRAFLWCGLLAVVLGLLFATKISTYAWLAAVAMAAVAGAADRRALVRSLAAMAVAAVAAGAIAWLLDPGLHAAPLEVTMSRLDWRLLRVEIQRMVFVSETITSNGQRLAFASFVIFFSSVGAYAVLVLGAAEVAGLYLTGRQGSADRRELLAVAVAAYAFFLALMTLPLTWVHYTAVYVPFLVLLAGVGAARIWRSFAGWRGMAAAHRIALAAAMVVLIVSVATTGWAFRRYRWHVPPKPTPEASLIACKFAFSLAHPGSDAALHRELAAYFEGRGDEKWAAYERHWLEEMEKAPKK